MRPLARAAAPLLCAAVLVAGAPSLAAETGAIEGRVVNRATGRPQAGVEVVLNAGRAGAAPEETTVAQRTRSDGRGRFRFAHLATGQNRLYTLDARFEGGLFAGRALTLPAGTDEAPVIDATIGVWPTTTDPEGIVVARDSLFVLPGEGEAAAIESVKVVNSTARAYIGRGGKGQEGTSPSLAFALPAGAQLGGTRIVDASLDVPELLPSDVGGFGITVALPPGESTFTFTYPLEATAGRIDLSRRALYPTLELSVLAGEPLTVEGDRLRPDGAVELEGRTYRRWSAPDTLDAGDALQAEAFAEAGSDPPLVGGLVFLAVALLAAVGGSLLRRRRTRPAHAVGPTPAAPRAAVIEEIAALDLRRRAGEVSEQEWAAQRAELKGRLAETGEREPEPAP